MPLKKMSFDLLHRWRVDVQVVQTGAALAYTGFVTPKDPDADTPILQVNTPCIMIYI
jgi:hypothetical protein